MFESARTVIERLEPPNDISVPGTAGEVHDGKFADVAMRVLHVKRLFPKAHNNDDPFLKKYTSMPGENGCIREHEEIEMSTTIVNTKAKEMSKSLVKKPSGFINIDPFSILYLFWLFIVSIGVGYNYWTTILRIAFIEGMGRHYEELFALDYFIDLIFLLDIYMQSRTGYMENGELVHDILKTRYHYMKTIGFWLDCLAIIPFDFLYLIFGVHPVFRLARLLKVHRFITFYQRIQAVTNRPNLFNLVMLLHHVFLIIHWVACAYFLVSKSVGYGSEPWVYPVPEREWAEVRKSQVWCIY